MAAAVLVEHDGQWLPGQVLWQFQLLGRARAVVRYTTASGFTYVQSRWLDELRMLPSSPGPTTSRPGSGRRGRTIEAPLVRLPGDAGRQAKDAPDADRRRLSVDGGPEDATGRRPG